MRHEAPIDVSSSDPSVIAHFLKCDAADSLMLDQLIQPASETQIAHAPAFVASFRGMRD